MAHGVLSPGVNLESSQAIATIQALCSSMKRVFDCLKVGTWNEETLEGCEKGFGAAFQESLRSLSHNLGELQCLSNQVFQKEMDHATTALLPYQLPWMPDVVVRSSVTWLRSYIKLCQAPCQRCRKFLQDGLLPVWRDFQTLGAFRDTCRQE